MMEERMKWHHIFTFALLIGSTGMMIYTFFVAYTNPGQSIEVFVNRYGEAKFEIIMLFFLIPIGLYSGFDWYRMFTYKDSEKHEGVD